MSSRQPKKLAVTPNQELSHHVRSLFGARSINSRLPEPSTSPQLPEGFLFPTDEIVTAQTMAPAIRKEAHQSRSILEHLEWCAGALRSKIAYRRFLHFMAPTAERSEATAQDLVAAHVIALAERGKRNFEKLLAEAIAFRKREVVDAW